MKISREDSDWVIQKLAKWKISDVYRLLKIFNCHITAVPKTGLGVKKTKKANATKR